MTWSGPETGVNRAMTSSSSGNTLYRDSQKVIMKDKEYAHLCMMEVGENENSKPFRFLDVEIDIDQTLVKHVPYKKKYFTLVPT